MIVNRVKQELDTTTAKKVRKNITYSLQFQKLKRNTEIIGIKESK